MKWKSDLILFFYTDNRISIHRGCEKKYVTSMNHLNPIPCQIGDNQMTSSAAETTASHTTLMIIKGDFYGRLAVLHHDVIAYLTTPCSPFQIINKPVPCDRYSDTLSRSRYRKKNNRTRINNSLWGVRDIFATQLYKHKTFTGGMRSFKFCVNSFNFLVNILIVSCLNILTG